MTLEDILNATRAESARRQEQCPLADVQRRAEQMGPTRGFARALRARPFSIIAEIKKQSPSMGVINVGAIEKARPIYAAHPVVAAISVLTQAQQFGGSPEDLETVRQETQNPPKPLLRKDFIFSEYEVYFSRAIGADAILLMANVVENRAQFKRLHDLAVSLGLDVLCEIHDESEIAILPDTAKICGINSRRFKGVSQEPLAGLKVKEGALGPAVADRDTQTDLNTFILFEKLAGRLPADCLRVAESGISAGNIGAVLRRYPFNAALIGTSLLKAPPSELPKLLDAIQREADAALAFPPGRPAKSEVSCAV